MLIAHVLFIFLVLSLGLSMVSVSPATVSSTAAADPRRTTEPKARVPLGIDRPIQIRPPACYANVCFIHPPGAVRLAHLTANPLTQNWRISLVLGRS